MTEKERGWVTDDGERTRLDTAFIGFRWDDGERKRRDDGLTDLFLLLCFEIELAA